MIQAMQRSSNARSGNRNDLQPALALSALGVAFALFAGPTAQAQPVPDAGRILRDATPARVQPLEPSVELLLDGGPLVGAESGGLEVRLESVRVTGNTVFAAADLHTVIGDVAGRSFDLGGLRNLANRISEHYRANGYPFARAYLPAQNIAGGELLIEVVEGRYGEVHASGDPALTPGAERFLRTLESGDVIDARGLERATLLLGDLPGVTITPVMRPGETAGSGDLDVMTASAPRLSMEVGSENHGNRYSGAYRTTATVRVNRAARFGDEVLVRATYTDQGMWLGQVGYELPVGTAGLRANVGYARTSYDLRAPFDDYSGTANVGSVGLSYPLLRSRAANLVVTADFQHKDLDTTLLGHSIDAKTNRSWPIGLQFDRRDGFGGSGITWGALEVAPGRLRADSAGALDGSFTRVSLQAARLQSLKGSWSLLARLSSQWADAPLDSSESFVLGGAAGVRAYPQGEAAGSEGWLGQIEVRYSLPRVAPYVFHDAGRIEADALQARRRIAGSGVGARYSHGGLSVDAALAWRTAGGPPQGDTHGDHPRAWLSVRYAF